MLLLALFALRPSALALTEEQALVVDVWREVNRQFVDGDFNGLGPEGWKKKKLDAVKSVAGSEVVASCSN